MSTLFEKIIAREIPATIEFEDDEIIAIRDIAPNAPLHLLIIPKKPIPSVNQLTTDDEALIGRIYLTAQRLAKQFGVDQAGYRLITNTNADAGQTIFHLHIHLLGGEPLGPMNHRITEQPNNRITEQPNNRITEQLTSTLKESGLLLLFAIGLAIGFNHWNPRSIDWIKPTFERIQATDSDLGLTEQPNNRITEQPNSQTPSETTSKTPSETTSKTPSETTSKTNSETNAQLFKAQPGVVKEITKAQFVKLMKGPHFMIDARTAESYAKGHIGSAVNFYGGEAEMLIPQMLSTVPRDQVILIYCDGGECELSHHIADALKQFQYGPMYIYTGGWAEWTK